VQMPLTSQVVWRALQGDYDQGVMPLAS